MPGHSQGLHTGFPQVVVQHTAAHGASVPVLYKQYTELCTPGGVRFLDFNVDRDFGNCIDGLVVVDTHQLKDNKRKRYIEDSLGISDR